MPATSGTLAAESSSSPATTELEAVAAFDLARLAAFDVCTGGERVLSAAAQFVFQLKLRVRCTDAQVAGVRSAAMVADDDNQAASVLQFALPGATPAQIAAGIKVARAVAFG